MYIHKGAVPRLGYSSKPQDSMSSKFQVQCIDEVKTGQLDATVELCVRAYRDSIATASLVGGDETLKNLYFRSMIRAGLLGGQLYLATESQSDKIVAVALWLPPGKSLYDTEEQKDLGFNELMGKITPETKSFWDNYYRPKGRKFLQEMLGPMGGKDSWYLNLIATDPPYQRRGIATMLLETVYKQTAGSGSYMALCATNNENEAFYNSVGFVTKGMIPFVSPIGDYPVICLTRNADLSES